MITRLYADNYICLVNFEFRPQRLQLIAGLNGSGKSTVRELIRSLGLWITGEEAVESLFPTSTLTRWQTQNTQTFEIDIDGNGGSYHYMLKIEHQRSLQKCRVVEEEIRFDDHLLYRFDGSEAHLFRDPPDTKPGPVFPFDWSRTAIATIPEREENKKLIWFRQRMKRMYCLAIDPFRMSGLSEREEENPYLRLNNIASWYRHIVQDDPEIVGELLKSLREVIDGLKTIRLVIKSDQVREMEFVFEQPPDDQVTDPSGELRSFGLRLDQLSEGQRCLVGLYLTLLAVARRGGTLIIDEPDNFIALREMQPWLNDIEDAVERSELQCIIISHHPEFLNRLAATRGALFHRGAFDPTRIKEFSAQEGLTPAEAMARGWEV